MNRIQMIAAHGFRAAAALLAGGSVTAQDLPGRPIRVIVTNSPGTTSDALARVLATAMARFLAQPVIVKNKAGAGNLIGFEYAANRSEASLSSRGGTRRKHWGYSYARASGRYCHRAVTVRKHTGSSFPPMEIMT